MARTDPLQKYRDKRHFGVTPEPEGGTKPAAGGQPIFVIQKHDATRLHYDFRLEVEGVLKSWAVPKGPSTDPAVKRLAMPTEDHPMGYAGFEGTIPEGEYGAGTVIVWDRGTYRNLSEHKGEALSMEAALEEGRVKVWLEGEKLRGGYALARTRGTDGRPGWLLIKLKDEHADTADDLLARRPESVLTGRTLEQVASPPASPRKRARPVSTRKAAKPK